MYYLEDIWRPDAVNTWLDARFMNRAFIKYLCMKICIPESSSSSPHFDILYHSLGNTALQLGGEKTLDEL